MLYNYITHTNKRGCIKMNTIGKRIKQALEDREMIQADLVERTGLPKSAISSYINGKYDPKQQAIYLIAKALNVSEAWLMGYDVEESKETKDEREKRELLALIEGLHDKDIEIIKDLAKRLKGKKQ